jgi:large subunit ribosomal protein L7/L12
MEYDDPPSGDAFSQEEPGLSLIKRRWPEMVPASNPAPPDFGAGRRELVLVEAGSTPIELIKRIREITGFGLLDSRALLESCPSVVVTGLDEAQAAGLGEALRSAGATIEIRSGKITH